MNKANYFFERTEFKNAEIKKPFYLYKGYCIETKNGPYHPVVLHFGKDEIVISYKDTDGSVDPVFSLYVADGELNQKMLTKKIEGYWKMPLWPLNRDIILKVDKTLLSISYFSSLYEFDVVDDKFKRCKLFERANSPKELKLQPEELRVTYLTGKNKKTESWCIETGDIYTCNINFRKILLDFLYELDYTNTFEDTNFFKLQPVLQNNTLLDALSRKCRYLDELYKLRDYKRRKATETLPKRFLDAEKAWLKVCFNKTYLNVFISADSIFGNVEEEAELVLFRSRIGFRKQKRSKLFRKEDYSLRNQSATFFLRRYSLYNAFRTLLHPAYLIALTLSLLLMPLGDLFLDKFAPAFSGISSIGLPLLMLVGLMLYYYFARINLFKLLLPRLFLGIMLGWTVFWSTEEIWQSALIANASKIIVVNFFILIIICLYIFTDIRNKLIRVSEGAILRRTALLLMFAMLISFVQGFYVIQFKAMPILENSDFLEKINPASFHSGAKDMQNATYQEEKKPPGLDKVLGSFNVNTPGSSTSNDSAIYSNYNGLLGANFENFKSIKIFSSKYHLRYIWSVHLSQFVMSILIGVVLQLLWEDRPVTEPL